MDDMWARFVSNLTDRVTGSMQFRLFLQPVMAATFATISGIRDARAHKPPYLWALATDPARRMEMLKDGWKSIRRVFILALVIDVVYQIIELHFVYPGEAIVVALVLAIVPYLILRGLVNRLVSAMNIFTK
jgi:hypothetical protein